MDDWDLLAEYRTQRSQPAFAELVRRHLPLVFGVCRRRLRDAALAEDVSQSVFLLLARRPPKQCDGVGLAGWLFKTALYASANAMRMKQTRLRHESAAAAGRVRLNGSYDCAAGEVSDAEQLLYGAMESLRPRDRDIVLLRFYEGLEVQEAGRRLGLAPNTATKRLARAVERLRDYCTKNGAAAATAGIVETLAMLRDQPLSAGFADRVATAAMGTAPPQVVVLTQRMIQMIRRTQISFYAAVTAMAIVIGGGGVVGVVALLHDQPAPRAMQAIAGDPVDPRAPKEVLKVFAQAARSGDAEVMKKLVEVVTPEQKRLLEAACSFAQSAARLRANVAKAFGEPAAQKLAEQQLGPLDGFYELVMKTVDKAPESIEGEWATIQPGEPEEPFVLHRVEGSWKVSAERMTETWTPQQIEQRLGMLKGAGEMTAQFAEEVHDGKYATFDEFAAAVQKVFSGR